MGRKGSWFSAVKRALAGNGSSEKKERRKRRARSKVLSRETSTNSSVFNSSEPRPLMEEPASGLTQPSSPIITDIIKLTQAQTEQNKHVYSVALATAAAAEAAVAAAQAAAEIVRLTTASYPNMKLSNDDDELMVVTQLPKEPEMSSAELPMESEMAAEAHKEEPEPEPAAVKIQSAYRGYKARKETKTLRSFSRLKTLVESKSAKRQAMTTLKCMQTLAHVQSQVQIRRIQMTEENLALKNESNPNEDKWIMGIGSPKSYSKEQIFCQDEDNLNMGSPRNSNKHKMRRKSYDQARVNKIKEKELVDQDWIGTPQSKEQMDAMMMSKQEAAIKRERALAYSHSRQQSWRNQLSKKETQITLDSENPNWEWNWLDKWVTNLPSETEPMSEKVDHSNSPNPRLSSGSSPRSKPPTMAKRSENTRKSEGNSPTHRTQMNSSPNNARTRHVAPSPLGNTAASEKLGRVKKSFSMSSPSHSRQSSFSSTKSVHVKDAIVVQ